MSLFSEFKDTIFLKEESELENKINKLQELKTKYPDNKDLDSELRIAKAGLDGEKEIEYVLKNANIGMYVLHDITLVVDDLKAQIDYIVITPAKCYFIECKNLVGKITVDNTGQFIREYDGKKMAIESPLSQSKRHREVRLKIAYKSKGFFKCIFFKEKKFEEYHDAIVVFANKSSILDMKYAPKEITQKVIRVENLIDYMKNDVKNAEYKDSKKSMKEYAEWYLKQDVKEEIDYEEKLKLKQICPDCGGTLIQRKGQYGPFMGCSNYPNCKYIKKLEKEN